MRSDDPRVQNLDIDWDHAVHCFNGHCKFGNPKLREDTMIAYRPVGELITDTIKERQIFSCKAVMIRWLCKQYECDESDVSIEPYGWDLGYHTDKRVHWGNTFIIKSKAQNSPIGWCTDRFLHFSNIIKETPVYAVVWSEHVDGVLKTTHMSNNDAFHQSFESAKEEAFSISFLQLNYFQAIYPDNKVTMGSYENSEKDICCYVTVEKDGHLYEYFYSVVECGMEAKGCDDIV